MARRISAALLLVLSFGTGAISRVHAQEAKTYTLSLDAQLELIGSGTPIKDESQVVVWLTPAGHHAAVIVPEQHFRIVQRNKKFAPNFLVLPQGSTVDFPNLDPWFHNVFSQFRGKRFDLGLYQAGSQRSVKFDMAGVSYLFCNIHPEMSAIIVAVDSNLFAITDKSGHAKVNDIPPGKYDMHVWYRDAPPESLKTLERLVDMDQDKSVGPIVIQAKPQAQQTHKNKYGKDYDPTPLNPEY